MKPVRRAPQYHRRRLIETLARLVHGAAERLELAPGQAASHAKTKPAVTE